nr:hypothetical protein [Tanacetum cinerariifolium]
MATQGNGDPPVLDPQTMEELCQPSLNGRGGPIAPISIQATKFRLKNDMIQQVQNSFQFHGLSGDDAKKNLNKFLHVTQSIKVNGVTDDALRLYLFPHSLTHHATACESSSSITSSSDLEIIALKAKMVEINKNLMKVLQINQQVKAVSPSCETCGGPHSYNDCLATVGQTQNVYDAGAYQGGNSYQPQALAYQASGYQALVHQPSIPQSQVVTTTEFTNYMKANDAIPKNMQTNMTSLKNSNLELKNMFGQFIKMNTASSLGSETLPSNTITNPEEDLKGITTRSGTAYQGPTIPTTFSSLPKVVEHETEVTKDTVPPTKRSKDVQPSVVQIETPIPNSEPVVASVIEPVVAPEILLKTGRALIDVYTGELTLRVNNEAVTFNLDQTSRYSANYNDMTANRIDIIDMAYEKYSQEVLGFSNVIASGNPTPYYDPIISTSSPTLTPFGDSDFLLEEVDAFLVLEDDPTSPDVDHSSYVTEGDILLLEAFLNDDPSLPPPTQGMYLPQIRKELKIFESKNDKSVIDEPPEVELKGLPPHLEYTFLERDDKLPIIIAKYLSIEEKAALIKVLKSHKQTIAWKLSDIKGINPEFCTQKILVEDDFKPMVQHQRRVNPKIHEVIKKEVLKLLDAGLIYLISDGPWEKSHFMVKDGIVLGHKISKNEIKVNKAKVDVITKLPHPTTVKGIHSFLGHAGFYRRFIQDFSKIARPMTRLLEKDTLFFFFKECVEAFQTLKRKLTEAPILVAPDWDLAFELMCDASDFAIGAVQGQRKTKHFQPIHYTSKTMTNAQAHYTTTEKELLAVVYAFEKFWPYLVLSKSIVYTNHSALKYLFKKQDAK